MNFIEPSITNKNIIQQNPNSIFSQRHRQIAPLLNPHFRKPTPFSPFKKKHQNLENSDFHYIQTLRETQPR